jgi:hypothetical protein
MITLRTPILIGHSDTVERDVQTLIAYALAHNANRKDEVVAFFTELGRLCGLTGFNIRILGPQSYHEVFNPITKRAYDSRWWVERLNPSGIGITGVPAQNEASRTWANGTESAKAHVAHMYAYVVGNAEIPVEWQRLDPRFSAVFQAGFAGTVAVLGDLGNGKWATDPEYATKIMTKANEIFDGSDAVIVAKACPIEIRVVTQAMNNRPQLAMPDTSFVTVHEVGNLNPGADEEMHARFVHNGGGENAVSFHFIVGPTKAIQLIYLNENAWHASDYYYGRGNRDSWAIETVQVGDFDKTLSHLAYLIAELYRNPRRFSYRSDIPVQDDLDPALAKERTKRHYDWAPDKKWCPQFILTRQLWPVLLDAVAEELKPVAPNLPTYAPPLLPDWWSEQALLDLHRHRSDGVLYQPLGARITALKETGAYAHPWLPDGKGKRTRANIQKGETVDLRYRAKSPKDGSMWGITRYGTWVSLPNFTPRYTVRNVPIS